MSINSKTVALTLMTMTMSFNVFSATIIEATWAGSEGWSIFDEDGNAPLGEIFDQGSVGGQDGLRIEADDDGVVGDKVFTTAAGFTGDYTPGAVPAHVALLGVQSIKFDFYSAVTGPFGKPSYLDLYFHSSVAGGIWRCNVLPSINVGWSTLSVNLASGGAPGPWYSMNGRTSSDWLSDLAAVDEIGFMINYQPGVADQIYGIDNFSLDDVAVPEPEEYAMLAMLAISLGFVFRDKLNAHMATVLAFAQK